MNNEELEQVKKDSTTFVDELKDKIHEQQFEIDRLIEELKREKQAFINIYNTMQKAIEIIERHENKAPIEVVLNDIAEALKALKGSDK